VEHRNRRRIGAGKTRRKKRGILSRKKSKKKSRIKKKVVIPIRRNGKIRWRKGGGS